MTKISQEKQYRIVAKNTITLGGAQLIQMLITLIRAKVIAILVGSTGMGINSLILSALTITQQVSSIGIYQSGVREISATIGNQPNLNQLIKIRKIFLTLSLLSGIAGSILMIILSPLFSILLFNNTDYTKWFIIVSSTLIFMSLQNGYGVIMQATQNIELIAKSSIIGGISGLIPAITLFYIFKIKAIVPVFILSYAIFYLSFRYFEHKIKINKPYKYTKDEFLIFSKPILKLGIMLMASMITSTFFSFMLNFFISRYGSIEDVGIYQSATSIITQGMSIIYVILASDFFPRISTIHTNNVEMKILIKQQSDIILFIITPISVLIISLAPFIIWILLSPQFNQAIKLIQIMGIGIIFRAIWIILSYIILAKGDKKNYFIFDALLGNGINFIISIIGFYYEKLEGLAFAYLAGSIFMVGLLWIMTKCKYKISLAFNDILKAVRLSAILTLTYIISTYTDGMIRNISLCIICLSTGVYSFMQLNKRMNIFKFIQ